jgi:hypothetical protein
VSCRHHATDGSRGRNGTSHLKESFITVRLATLGTRSPNGHRPAVSDDSRKLVPLYGGVRGSRAILACVARARARFEHLFARRRGPTPASPHISAVHSYEDVAVQAFIAALPSLGRPAEMVRKAYFTYATHWIDDVFDQFNFGPALLRDVRRERRDLSAVLVRLPWTAPVIDSLYASRADAWAIQKGLHRLLYGALINHATSEDEHARYLEEHAELFCDDVDARLCRRITAGVSPAVLGLTNKTAQELWFGCEPVYDPNLAALYTLLYTPAFYHHDDREERESLELTTCRRHRFTRHDLTGLITLFAEEIDAYDDPRRPARFAQLALVVRAFDGLLPGPIRKAYEDLLAAHRGRRGQPAEAARLR